MTEEEKFDLFERHLRGELNAEEQIFLKKLLEEKPELQRDLALQRLALQTGERLAEQDLQEKFTRWGKALDAKEAIQVADFQKNTSSVGWRGAWILSGMLAVAVLLWFVFFKNEKPANGTPIPKTETPSQPPNQPSEPEPTPGKTTPSQPSSDPKKSPEKPSLQPIAMAQMRSLLTQPAVKSGREKPESDPSNPVVATRKLLESGRYQDALASSEKIPDAADMALLRGMSLFFLENFTAAEEAFGQYERSGGSADLADWCLLLCCAAGRVEFETACAAQIQGIERQPEHTFRAALEAFLKKKGK